MPVLASVNARRPWSPGPWRWIERWLARMHTANAALVATGNERRVGVGDVPLREATRKAVA
jgi:hypothetical protein